MAKFVYSAYWHTWSRVLSESHPSGPYVEIDLTTLGLDWDRVANGWVRFHGTQRDQNDKEVNELPDEVWRLMCEKLGTGRAVNLTTSNFMEYIDYEKYKNVCNGGAAVSKITKGQ